MENEYSGGNETRSLVRDLVPTIVGDFEVEQLIGRGGMARVYRSRRLGDNTPAALKILDAACSVDRSIQERFWREARAIQSLDHPNIVPLMAYGDDEGTPYLALKLIEGCTVSELVAALRARRQSECGLPTADDPTIAGSGGEELAGHHQDALQCLAARRQHQDEFKNVADLAATAADALHAAHQAGIVHRDVKPSNLMLDREGCLWLTDFGLASMGDAHTVVTQTGQVIGTPHYMSPEQSVADTKRVDQRSDVYSLGATLYELATYQRPFQGDKFRVLFEISTGRLTRPSKVRPGIPGALEAIILKAMSFSPADRYASAAQMAEDLRRFVSGRRTIARQPGPADHVMRLITNNPRASISTLVGLALVVAIVIALEHVGRLRLSSVNSQLETANLTLADTNQQLGQINDELDSSRHQLQRYVYNADVADAYSAFAENNVDEVRQCLNRQIPNLENPDETDLRGLEWWILDRLCNSANLARLPGHQGAAREVRVVPGHSHLVSVGDDGHLRRFDLETHEVINDFSIGGQLDAVAISPTDSLFVTAQNKCLALFPVAVRDLDSGAVVHTLTRHINSVESVCFSPDGELIATADRYQEIQVHRTNGQWVGKIQTNSRNESLAFSGDGKRLLAIERADDAGGTQVLGSWNLPDLEIQSRWGFDFKPQVFALAGNSKRIAIAGADSLMVSSWPERQEIVQWTPIRGRIRCLAIDSEGSQVAAGCDNGLLYVWRIPSDNNQSAHGIAGPTNRVLLTGEQRLTSVTFIDDDHLAVSCEDGSVQIWPINRVDDKRSFFGEPTSSIAVPANHPEQVYLRTSEGTVARLDRERRRLDKLAEVPADDHTSIGVTPDGKQIAASSGSEIFVFSATDGELLQHIDTGLTDKHCLGLCWVNDQQRMIALYNDRILVYRTKDWKLLRVVQQHDGGVELQVAPDGQSVLIVARNKLIWFATDDFSKLKEYDGRLGEFSAVVYSRAGKSIAVGHQDGTVEVLRADNLQRTEVLRGHRDSILQSIFVDGDQKLITSASDDTIRFWDLAESRELAVLPIGASGNRQLYLEPASEQVESCLYTFGQNHPIRVWEAK